MKRWLTRLVRCGAYAAVTASATAAVQEESSSVPSSAPPPITKPLANPAAAPAGQEAPASGSRALEELLERLMAERAAGGLVAPTTTVPEEPAPDLAPTAVGAVGAVAAVRRIADAVQLVRRDGGRRDLAWWDSRAMLEAGDEVRLHGGRACALYEDSDGIRARFDGPAIWRALDAVGARPRQFSVDQLERFGEWWLAEGVDCVLLLPGGNECAGNGTRLTLHAHDRRAIELRVTGPAPVVVRSPYLGERLVSVAPGQRIFLPALPEPAAFVPDLVQTAELSETASSGALRVQATGTLKFETLGPDIALLGSGPVTGIARACGARVVVRSGDALRLTRVPLGTPRRQEHDE
jgi:hypothetical protein